MLSSLLCKLVPPAITQTVRPQPHTAEIRTRIQVILSGICCGKSDDGTGFPPSSSGFACHFHDTKAPCPWLCNFGNWQPR